MTCPHCGTPGQSGRRCASCGGAVRAGGNRSGVLVALLVALLVVIGGGVALALRSGQVAGAAVTGTPGRTEPTEVTRPDRSDEPEGPATSAEPPETSESAATDPTTGPSSESLAPSPDGPLKVGVVYDTGGSPPGSFNASAKAGVQRAKDELGVEVLEVDLRSESDLEGALTDLIEQGANPIIGIGYSFAERANELAGTHSDTNFVSLDGYTDGDPNMFGLAFSEEEGSFLVGAAAALKSATGKIAFLGATRNYYTGYYEAGFVAGAKAANPDIDVTVEYLGRETDETAWEQPEAAEALATTWYADGIDVVYSPSGTSATGVVDAAVLAGAGKWVIGYDYDDYLFSGPGRQQVYLTSMVKRFDEMLLATVEAAQDDDLESLPDFFGLAQNAVGYSTEGGFVDDIVPQLEDWKAQIVAGSIVVPYE